MNKKWLAILVGVLLIGIGNNCRADINKPYHVYIRHQNGLIDMEAKDAPLGDVLKELSDKTGIQIILKDTAIAKDSFSVNFKEVNIAEALKRILHDYSYFTTRSVNKLIRVIVYGSKKSDILTDQNKIILSKKSSFTEYTAPEAPGEIEKGPESLDEFRPIRDPENIGAEYSDMENEGGSEPNKSAEQRDMEEQRNRLDRALDALKSEHIGLYEEAINELVNINDSSSTNALFQTASSKDERITDVAKVTAARGLWHRAADQGFSNEACIAALHQLAQDDNPLVSEIAQDALKDMKNFMKMNTGE